MNKYISIYIYVLIISWIPWIFAEACGVDGVVPGAYCEPRMGTVGSQDTTGPMTRDELKDLACLGSLEKWWWDWWWFNGDLMVI